MMNKLLLLEDEESVSRGICFTLEKAGFQVYSCRTISEAACILEACQPQMLICDLTLPDGSGLDFIRNVREAQNNIYILCLTALDNETDFVMGYSAGADDYMAKPFSLSVLTLKVQAYFGRSTVATVENCAFTKMRCAHGGGTTRFFSQRRNGGCFFCSCKIQTRFYPKIRS